MAFSVFMISSAGTAEIGNGLELIGFGFYQLNTGKEERGNGVEVVSKEVILIQGKRGYEDGEHPSCPSIPKDISKCQWSL